MRLERLFSRRPRADGRDASDDFWYGPVSRSTAAGVNVNVRRALQLPVVYSAVQTLAQTIGALPFAVFERGADGSKIRRDDHPLMQVLREPNAEDTDIELFGQGVFDLASEGDAIFEVQPGRLGPVSEVRRLDPSKIECRALTRRLGALCSAGGRWIAARLAERGCVAHQSVSACR